MQAFKVIGRILSWVGKGGTEWVEGEGVENDNTEILALNLAYILECITSKLGEGKIYQIGLEGL